MKLSRIDFPKDFLFGAVASANSVEHHVPSISDRAGDRLGHQSQEFDLVQSIGFDGYRFPINWAQVLPEGKGGINQAGLDFYDRLADALLEREVRPCATLFQHDLPLAITDLGGWRNPDVANWFADFTEVIMGRIGDRMYSVAPISEPEHISLHNHIGNCKPSGHPDIRATARTMHHVLLAHGRAIQAMRGLGMSNLGAMFDLDWINASVDPSETAPTALFSNEFCKRFILGGVFHRAYPESVLEELEPHLPSGWQNDLETIGTPIDWYGLTFGAQNQTTSSDTATHNGKNTFGAPSQVLTRIRKDYTGDLPIYLTDTNPTSPTGQRPDSLSQHLSAILGAVKQNHPIKGCFLGSMADPETLKAVLTKIQPVSLPLSQPAGAMHEHWNLVADIGGTNTRLGVVSNGQLTDLQKYPTGKLPDLLAALHDLRDEIGTDPRAVVAAGAGPVKNGTIRLTNAHLDLSEDELAKATGAQHTYVINDFTAAAWSVAEITAADVEVLQGEANPPKGTRLVVGPGTGLGVGALLYSEGHYHTVSGEGGHMGLSPRHRNEVEIFEAARQIAPECFFDDSLTLEAEMFLSGTGLPILYQAVAMAGGEAKESLRNAKDILHDAREGSDEYAVRAAHMFTTHLGAIMGDLAVALVPAGGVFLVGGVAEKNRWLFQDDFLAAFNAGGRFDDLRRSMNLYVSEQDEFGIVGANNFCKNALAH